MEIWIAKGNKKELKKEHPFLREYAIIDIKEISELLGYESSINLNDHDSFVLNNEIVKRLESFNSSRRFYRVLYIVEEHREELPQDLLNYSMKAELKYEAVYVKKEDTFELACKSY